MSYDAGLFRALRRLPSSGCGFLYEHRWADPEAGPLYETPEGPRFDLVQKCACGATRPHDTGLDGRMHPSLNEAPEYPPYGK